MKSVYVIRANQKYKVGVAERPEERFRTLQLGNPDAELAYISEPISNAFKVEHLVHLSLKNFSIGREWFYGIGEEEIISVVRDTISKNGTIEKEENQTENQFVREDGIVYRLEEWVEKTIEETEKIRNENNLILDIISLVSSNPAAKKVVSGLVDCGWGYDQVKGFISQTNTRMLTA